MLAVDKPTPAGNEKKKSLEYGMPNGYYAKGNKSPDVYWIDQTTGKRRKVTLGELNAAQGFNQATGGIYGTGYVAVMDQATFDAIPVG
jgi:hypothetical protein